MVLLIEDEAVSRRALQTLLRLSGHAVKAVSSAEDALANIMENGAPDMAVVDVNLPGMSGVEFRRRLHQICPTVPCIFMSANDEVNLDLLRNTFHDSALRKPFDVGSLLTLMISAETPWQQA
jgi:CheY-like chemotaxis protein